ncbi:hypothetical protein DPEC_G00287660 [Dallia pectoralis]|uniref:Uncharacterized protein n=1 Tax=Dallia pectoralis TaxID=75939 RepID=A0ACC2FKJ3_DALPE|nr:hypothetical protein DPEC_G00287660 [Dallia pectoralis]
MCFVVRSAIFLRKQVTITTKLFHMETKWSVAVLLLAVAGSASGDITCSDGKACSDKSTCCMTEGGYACCPIPNAVCCPDMDHCCPSGFRCNAATDMCERENQPWSSVPMLGKVAAEEPGSPVPSQLQSDSSRVRDNAVESSPGEVVQCDRVWSCPDGYTCCLHPYGVWWCCPHPAGRCCLDGVHCCAYGYDCDFTFTRCVRYDNLRYPFAPREAPSKIKAIRVSKPQVPLTRPWQASDDARQPGVIHCDVKFFCAPGNSCCKGPTGKWGCCPYPLGQCCDDGVHCCEYGYVCDPTSSKCTHGYSQIPSSLKEDAKQN